MTGSSFPLRVLDLTDGLGVQAVRLMIGIGADVLRVHPDTDTDDALSPPSSLHWYAGVRTMAVPEAELEGTVLELMRGADIVLESGVETDLVTTRLRRNDPGLWDHIVHVVLTPFGLTGPRRRWLADDHVLAAAGGMTWLGGKPGGPPCPPPYEQARQLAGTHAAIAALLATLARRRTGRGQLVEVAGQEAVAATLETGAISWIHGGTVTTRTGGVYGHVAHRVFPTADGYVAGGYSGPERMWTDLLSWMDESGEAADLAEPIWADPVHRWAHRGHVDSIVAAWTQHHTTAQIGQEARRRALPWAEVTAPNDLPKNPQLQSRNFFLHLDSSSGEQLNIGFPYESPARPRPVHLAAARPAPTNARWQVDSAPVTPTYWQRRGSGDGALAGLRVLDLTWVLAGPYATKILAEHGADIIKIESTHRQDPTRFAPSMRLRPNSGPDESGYFLNFNRNKRSLALNLRTHEGPDILRRLAVEADVVVENFSPGTLSKWGMDAESLQRINPAAILVSMAGVGATGPWQSAVTFADTLAAWSGLTHATAGSDGAPEGFTFGLGDMVAANAAVLAILERLLHGTGGHIDLSQLEAMAAHLGPALLLDPSQSRGGRSIGPLVLRAPGDDRWLAVGATDPSRLAPLIGCADPVAWLTAYAAATDADDAAAILQAHGVPAYPVRDGRDLVDHDPQLSARGFYPHQDHPTAGSIRVEGIVHHLTGTPGRLDLPAPLLGQHTDELLTELLHLSPAEIRRLRDRGVLE